jgi:hypothetical protein
MPKKRQSAAAIAKSEKLWIEETLKRLRALQQTREPKTRAAASKPARKIASKPSRPVSRRKKK